MLKLLFQIIVKLLSIAVAQSTSLADIMVLKPILGARMEISDFRHSRFQFAFQNFKRKSHNVDDDRSVTPYAIWIARQQQNNVE